MAASKTNWPDVILIAIVSFFVWQMLPQLMQMMQQIGARLAASVGAGTSTMYYPNGLSSGTTSSPAAIIIPSSGSGSGGGGLGGLQFGNKSDPNANPYAMAEPAEPVGQPVDPADPTYWTPNSGPTVDVGTPNSFIGAGNQNPDVVTGSYSFDPGAGPIEFE